MKPHSKFNLLETPLARGQTLIEASAGTGKTYAIAGIVLRLILEQNLEIDKILVTTYTELATAELRERIRRLFRETLTAFEEGHSPNDFIAGILLRKKDDPEASGRLQRAIQSFDQAAIYTIHGFCQRMLKDRAFESGTLFDAELVTDQSTILSEIVDDFWRCRFYTADPVLIAAAATHKLTRATLARDLDELVRKPTLEIRPVPEASEENLIQELIATHWEAARRCWLSHRTEIRALFARHSWAKKAYEPAQVSQRLDELELMFETASAIDGNGEAILFFSSSQLAAGTRAHQRTPEHEFFNCCQELSAVAQKFVLGIRAKFLAWARKEMVRRKVERNVLFYDDLLSRLYDSLGGPGGETLAGTIRDRFQAALIDEFQDTDPIQYAIFERIYGGSDTRLFLIGDPKQSIYGFRGADVFTYIGAAKKADYHYTLAKNWRSEAGLVEAVNTLFSLTPNPFLLEDISFEPAGAAGEADQHALTFNGRKPAPFQLWLSDTAQANNEANELLPQVLASEIVTLLQSNTTIGPRKVAPHDLAILVETNNQARAIQDALRERRVPSVIYGATSVFKSREAKELQLILAAVIEPGQEEKVRAALSTETLGLTTEELLAITANERDWENCLRQFQSYHEIWKERGFIQMLRTVVTEQSVRSRLLGYLDGERRLTNLLHLGELLHRMCVEGQLGMTGLNKRLGELINATELQSEEYEIRLESDEEAARVITIHKSKGLQYGIVFCPFSWKQPFIPRGSNVIFHQQDRIVLDLAETDEGKEAQRKEKRQDQMRVLYVALTRAEHRCSLVWGNFKNGGESAPAHLLGKWQDSGITRVKDHPAIATLPLPEVTDKLYLPEDQVAPSLHPRQFNRALDRTYGIASFTRLLSDQIEEPEIPEDDAIETIAAEPPAVVDEPALEGMAAFPRGTGPGTCLHHIFEELDFDNPSQLSSLVKARLQAFGIIAFDQIVSQMIENVLAASLDPETPELKLAGLGRDARLSELEFYFPLGRVTDQKLTRLFQNNRLRFQTMTGFMKGFIDLIFEHQGRFYIVDWKSNWLGSNPEAYTQEAMDEEMTSKFYHLQLSIYTVALHRLLRARMPGYAYERHFGGVFYLFLRGIEPSRPDLGIWRTRPPADFVEQLSGLFDHDT